MKKLLAITALTFSTLANAHPPHVGGYGVWPMLIGGTVGYMIAERQRPVVIQQPPVYINSSPVYNIPTAPQQGATPIYERRSQWDPACNCYVVIYNQIGWQ